MLGQPRSSQRYTAKVSADEPKLISRILNLVSKSPRFGYRQITRMLRLEGWNVNAKRIYRLWKREGLKVPQKKQKRTRLGTSAGGITRRQAEHRNHVWSMDFIFDRTSNGRPVKIFSLVDEYTRECIALEVGRKFTSEDLVSLLVKLFSSRGVPKYLRCDNGPEFISRRLQQFVSKVDVEVSYVAPGSPWQNGYIESFHSRLRDECLACEEFPLLADAKAVISDWRERYNHQRPHSALGGLPPVKFAEQSAASVRPTAELQQQTPESLTQTVPS